MSDVDSYGDMYGEVAHPSHYAENGPRCPHCDNTIECITITERENFNVGNSFKYLWRRKDKGKLLQDLRKARWYIDREIQRVRGGE